jgi:hypothetical protein
MTYVTARCRAGHAPCFVDISLNLSIPLSIPFHAWMNCYLGRARINIAYVLNTHCGGRRLSELAPEYDGYIHCQTKKRKDVAMTKSSCARCPS